MRPAWLVLPLLTGVTASAAAAQKPPPETPVRLVVDTLYGTPVADPYRWLETGSDEVTAWFRAQGAYARAALDALPGRAALLERIRAIGASASADMSLPDEAGGRWFYTVRRASEQVARGYIRDAWTGQERLLVDPAKAGGSGAQGANTLSSFLPSPDGRLVLYGISSGGSENVVLRVRDVDGGHDVAGPIRRNRWREMASWSPDGRSFFYLQLRDLPADAPPTDLLRDITIFRHRIGEDPGSDTPVFSAATVGHDARLAVMRPTDRMAEPRILDIDARNDLAFAFLRRGVERRYAGIFVASADDLVEGTPAWRTLFTSADSVREIAAHGRDLYVLTEKGAPLGRIVRTDLDSPDLTRAEMVMAEGDHSLLDMGAALDALYVRSFAEGAHRITRIPWGGSPTPVELPAGTSAAQARTDPLRSGVRVRLDSWTAVPRWYRYNPSTRTVADLSNQSSGGHDRLDGFVAETVFAPGHDGVPIPLTIVRPDSFAREGSMPVILYGYGAYGFTLEQPARYTPELLPWFEAGGAWARCEVRGGGYYGEAWHRAGQKATKPNSWLDYIACAEYLIREGYTRPDRLVASGVSAGGITVGRAITERPDLFAAAIIMVGLLDAVRFETTPNGPPNIPEFGSVATEEGFRALLAMSAVHHVRPGARYPAVLLTTGLNDPRLAPWQVGKMAAALQAATTSGRPVLLRVDETAGHAALGNTEEQLRQTFTDVLAFMMKATGMPAYRTPGR